MSPSKKRWIYLIVLSLIWGSSFILMKKSLVGLSPIQVGTLRIIFTAITLLIFGFKSIFKIKKIHYKPLFITAALGTFIPVFLFAYAIKGIDSSITSILNSLTPLNTLIIGAIYFGFKFNKFQKFGVFVGFLGTLILILSSASINPNQNYIFALLPIIASIGYAINVNVLKNSLSNLNALSITTGNFIIMLIPAFIILYFTDFFNHYSASDKTLNLALLYLAILSVFGTALAKTMFNRLVQISSPVFSSSVTYLIPVIAVFLGILDGEKFISSQILASVIIFGGVYLSSKKKA